MNAIIHMPACNTSGFKFIDCVATWETESDPPAGYQDRSWHHKEHGFETPGVSSVAGLIGGSVQCEIYLEQFNIPCKIGTKVHFYMGPKIILDACVQAIKEDRYPPEYNI